MEPPPSAPARIDRDGLRAALHALYVTRDASSRAAADAWLQRFLRSDEAWPVSLALLGDDATSPRGLDALEALFCARALHVLLRRCVFKTEKTQKSHVALDERALGDVRDAGLLPMAWRCAALCATHDRGVGGVGGGSARGGGADSASSAPPRTILTQVSLAIAALACKMAAWEGDAIARDLCAYFTRPPASAPPSATRVVAALLDHRDVDETVADAGATCLLQTLSVLPDECQSGRLSIHPARRREVIDGLRAAAAAAVFPTLDALTGRLSAAAMCVNDAGSSGGVDRSRDRTTALLFEAYAAWAAFAPDAAGACPSETLAAALGILAASDRDARATFSDRTLVAAVAAASAGTANAVHRAERREALSAAAAAMRARCGGGGGAEGSARAVEVLSSVCEAARASPPGPPPPPDPLGTGKDAAPDRTYIPYKEFAKLKRERRKSAKAAGPTGSTGGGGGGGDDDGGGLSPRADLEVLCFCLDALSDALARGVASPAAALAPWTAMREGSDAGGGGEEKHQAARSPAAATAMLACAARAAHAAAIAVRLPSASERTDHGDKYDDEHADAREELGEGLRDVAGVVGADAFFSSVAVRGLSETLRGGGDASSSSNLANPSNLVGGWTHVLFATARLCTPRGDPAAVAVAVDVLGDVARRAAADASAARVAELATWALGGLNKAMRAQPVGVLARALDAAVACAGARDVATARAACVTAMRLCESCARVLANGDESASLEDNARAQSALAALAAAHASGGVMAPANSALRRGQEPVRVILCRALASVAAARAPAAAAEAATAGLAAAAIVAASNAAATAIDVARGVGASPTTAGIVATLDATLDVVFALTETTVAIEACLKATRIITRVDGAAEINAMTSPPGLGSTARDVIERALLPALERALDAAVAVTPAHVHAGGGVDRVRDITRGCADALSLIVGESARNPAARASLGACLRLALDAYVSSPETRAAFLGVFVCALSRVGDAPLPLPLPLPAGVGGLWAEHRSRVLATVGGVAAAAAAAAASSGVAGPLTTRCDDDDARVAALTLCRALLRVGASDAAPMFSSIATVALEALRDGASGDVAVASLALASDVLSAPAMLSPSRFAPGRSPESAAAASAVHPGMGRLASGMSDATSRGSHLPRWARADDLSAATLAEAAHILLSDGGAAAALTRAQLECANGVMIPGLVTDVAASMFAAWAASGDATYMRWLSDALGGDGDGFPRRGTTAAQKGEFSRALLAQPPAPGEGEGEGGGGGIGGRDLAGRLAKMDLRRFKRTLKAFCGGKKAGPGGGGGGGGGE